MRPGNPDSEKKEDFRVNAFLKVIAEEQIRSKLTARGIKSLKLNTLPSEIEAPFPQSRRYWTGARISIFIEDVRTLTRADIWEEHIGFFRVSVEGKRAEHDFDSFRLID